MKKEQLGITPLPLGYTKSPETKSLITSVETAKFTFRSIDQHEYLPSDQPDPHTSAQGCLEAESLRAAIARLPDTQAEVISLRFLEQYSVREVASLLNRTELSVRALQFRGIKVLRESMAREIG